MNTKLGYVAAATLSLFVVAVAAAQAPPKAPPPPPTAPGGPGGGPPGGDGPRDPNQFIDRMMEGDADHDGKLSKSELPAPIAERIFERADTNKDGFLTREELVVFTSQEGWGRGQAPGAGPGLGERGPGGGRGGQQQSFEGGMKQAGRGVKLLKDSAFDAASKAKDLESVQAIQGGLVAAKGQVATVPMSAKATEKFGTDKVAYETAMRRQILAAISQAIAMEIAVLDGKAADAKAAYSKLGKEEDTGHSFFQTEEDERPAPPPGGIGGTGAGPPPARGPRQK